MSLKICLGSASANFNVRFGNKGLEQNRMSGNLTNHKKRDKRKYTVVVMFSSKLTKMISGDEHYWKIV